MATILSSLITGIKQFIAKIEERAFLTNGQQATPGTSQHPSSRNGAAHNGQTNGTSATRSTSTIHASPSHAERDEFWKTRQDIPPQEQLRVWEQSMEDFLEPIRNDPANRDHFDFLRRLLRQNGQAVETVEVSANALYTLFMLGEANGDIQYFAKRIADTNTHEQIRHNAHLIQSLAEIYGSEAGKRALPLILALTTGQDHRSHASASPDDRTLFSTLGTDIATGQDVLIPMSDRPYALASFGAIGSGKSTFALNLILQDCRQGIGVVLVEPHGDLTRAVLGGLPDSRVDDVVYLDLTDCAAFPFGINPFQCDALQDAAAVAKTANFVHHTFMRTWDFGHHTPVLAMVLRHVTRLLIENPGSSFADIPLLFHEDTAREKLVSSVTASASHTKAFWQQYNTLSPRERRDLIASTENKIDAYLSEPLIANILSQAKTTIDFGTLLNEGKIVLINLSPQLEEISRLLGSLILGRILMSAYQRASVPESERVPCHVYVDEWSRFCSDDLAVLIAESRKFKVIIGGLFNQTLETISDSNRATALQVGTLVTFRVSGNDARVLARSYSAALSQQAELIGQEPVRAVVTDPIAHLLRHAHPDARVATFAQTYLQNLEQFIKKPNGTYEHQHQWAAYYDCFNWTIYLTQRQGHQGRELITQSLYQSMLERRPASQIAPLAVYTLALAQGDGREFIFSPWVKKSVDTLKEFRDGAARFGTPAFITPESAAKFIQAAHKQYKWMAEAVISQMTQWQHVLTVLSEDPLLCDTGNFVPKYRQRSFTDLEAERANMMATQPNYQAFVKILTDEYVIKTCPPPPLLPESEVNERIAAIKQRMRREGYTKSYQEVEEEVRKRHELLRERVNDAPPPSHTTNGRPPRRLRQKPPPAFT